MEQQEREYWEALGADREKAEAFLKEADAAVVAMKAIADSFGADDFVTRGSYIAGMAFPFDKQPDGWKLVTKITSRDRYRPFYAPKRSTKVLKAQDEKMRSVRYKTSAQFTSHMGGHSTMKAGDGYGMRILYMGNERIGDKLLLSVPISSDPAKPCFASDVSRKLTMSEYWALREALDMAREAAQD